VAGMEWSPLGASGRRHRTFPGVAARYHARSQRPAFDAVAAPDA